MVVAKRTESHPPPFPVSSLDGPTDRRTHGLTPPPTLYYPHGLWCHCRCSLTAHSMGRTPPPQTAPSPADVLQHLAQGVYAWGGGKGLTSCCPLPPSFPTPPKGTRRVGPGAGTLSLHGPLPCPPLPPGFPTTHTHASIPPAMCVPMQEAMRPPPRSCPPLPLPIPPPQAVPPPPADSVYMTQCVSCRSYSLVYGD